MDKLEKARILNDAKMFFKENIISKHINNTKKLTTLDKFQVNPFLSTYLANFLTGNANSKSIAKALIYPRVLGTSINTTFGTQLQYFCSEVLSGFASTTSGIDIEFIDQIDGRRKYCQIKAGPNTINKDDVITITNHFTAINNLARTNHLAIGINDLIVGVFYGTADDLSIHYKNLNEQFNVIIGQNFWYHLTGDEFFYSELINAFAEVANEEDSSNLLEKTINILALDIENNFNKLKQDRK